MVEVYASENCIWCRRMRRYLDKKGVQFRTINALEPSNSRHVRQLTGQNSLPVTVIGDTMVIGFDRQAVDMALNNIR
ncbi:MAG: glutathione S-transferase N-terminal domain-containing protein [Ruminococcus sp.]|nr:glutathione S-transferase N-terminal domain-containing protein [Ruminococcus sp.]